MYILEALKLEDMKKLRFFNKEKYALHACTNVCTRTYHDSVNFDFPIKSCSISVIVHQILLFLYIPKSSFLPCHTFEKFATRIGECSWGIEGTTMAI